MTPPEQQEVEGLRPGSGWREWGSRKHRGVDIDIVDTKFMLDLSAECHVISFGAKERAKTESRLDSDSRFIPPLTCHGMFRTGIKSKYHQYRLMVARPARVSVYVANQWPS